jgi:hypothetical protein
VTLEDLFFSLTEGTPPGGAPPVAAEVAAEEAEAS